MAIDLRGVCGNMERSFDLEALIADLEIRVGYSELPGGAEGLSTELNGESWIFVSPSVTSARRRRFTLAHELGHWILAHPSSCGPLDILGRSSVPEEKAANEFAANLLMPPRLFRADVARAAPRMAEFERLANVYAVSRTAAALRFLKFTADACALVCISPARTWVAKSASAKHHWINGTLPDRYSSVDLRIGEARVPASNWLESCEASRSLVCEEIADAGPKTWLILLTDLPEAADEVDDLSEREAEEELSRRRQSFRRY